MTQWMYGGLDPGTTDKDLLQSILTPYPSEHMLAYPVSNAVGNVRNQGPELIEKIE
jgi:putative SOS response-associated peptidase YedK